MIIGLSGYARSGKDSVASFLTDFKRRAFADPIRDALYKLNPPITLSSHLAELVDEFGWDVVKVRFGEVRRMLQVLGKDVGREMFGSDVWIDIALASVHPDDNIIFTDVRFPNEALAIKKLGGEIWRVERDGVQALNDHPSETSMDDWNFDRIISNDGTLAQLAMQVSESPHDLAS